VVVVVVLAVLEQAVVGRVAQVVSEQELDLP
jgi:hypothetical protein